MKPEASLSNFSPEQPLAQYEPNTERMPDLANPESGVQKSAERYEQKSDGKPTTNDVGLASVLPTPVVSTSIIVNNTTIGDTPLVANDDDLIEKEWVDKAKKIVSGTKDDPYQREESINKLQSDYQKKRYGRELGAAV